MNKKVLATLPFIVLGSTAFAQSSVTLFGTVDQAATYVDGSDSWSGLQSGGNMDSHIGFRGIEDLGSGLKAQFWLEAGILADQGTGDSGSGLDFSRRATVGLLGNFGEIRLGRDESASYRAMKGFDVFNNAGIGGTRMWNQSFPGSTVGYDSKRKDNMVSYYSPNWGGFNIGVNYAFGERPVDTWENGSYLGLALGFGNGPWNAALTAEQQNDVLVPGILPAPALLGVDERAYSAGLGYDFGRFKVSGAYRQSRLKADGFDSLKGQTYTLGVAAPVGAVGVLKASYNRYEREQFAGSELKADQFSLGYEHNLSKRTALYGTYSYLNNKDNNGANLGLSMGGVPADIDGKQHGIQLGVRHSF
ncbi:MAG: porin [Comamonas sp.]